MPFQIFLHNKHSLVYNQLDNNKLYFLETKVTSLCMIFSSKFNEQSQANYSTLSNKKSHQCINCGLHFQSSYELLNHTKKFCTNSGFDTLAGLNVKLRNPNFAAQKIHKRQLNDSLTNALEEIQKNKAFVPSQKQFQNDFDRYQRDRGDLTYVRPYLHGSSKKTIQEKNPVRQSRSLHTNRNHTQQKVNQGYKGKESAYNPYEPSRSKAYSFTESHIKMFKQSRAYISPPSQLPQLQNAKHFSLLDRSDMSIKNMPEQEKRQYVVRKILELEDIEESYKKNGGRNEDFVQKTKKMKHFYQDLLADVNNRKDERFGKMSNGTRVSTPISKLEQLEQSNITIESNKKISHKLDQDKRQGRLKSRLGEIHQKSMAKRQDQIRKRFNTQFPQGSLQQQDYDIIDKDILSKFKSEANKQNQVIVIPIQQPAPPVNYQNNSSKQTQLMMKYLETVNVMKEQQNSQYLSLLEKQNQEMKIMYEAGLKNKEKQFGQNQNKIKTLEKNYQKLLNKFEKLKQKDSLEQYQQRRLQEERYQQQQQRSIGVQSLPDNKHKNFRVSNPRHHLRTQYQVEEDKEYRQFHPELDNVRLLNIEHPGYNIESQENVLSSQEKILMQMEHQERDEYQLFSHLPSQIQQLKLESLKSAAEKRFQMQKEVLKQKLEKLKIVQTMKQFEYERKLLSEELENQKKKIQIHKLMKKKIKHMVKEQFEQSKNKDDDESQSEELNQEQKDLDPFGPQQQQII